MVKTLLTAALFFVTATLCSAQQIESQKVFGGYRFYIDGQKLNGEELTKELQVDPAAFKIFKKAKTNSTVATILGGAGGALVGFPIGTAIGGGTPNWALAGIGAGLVAIGIPFNVAANKKAKAAVDLYNDYDETALHSRIKTEFRWIASGNSIGIRMNF